MKKIRLEIPLDVWKDAISNRIWIKINGNEPEIFKDQEFTKPIRNYKERVRVDVEIPEELETMEVIGLGGMTPIDDICTGWCFQTGAITDLKKATIITDEFVKDMPIINGRPDFTELKHYYYGESWAIEAYTIYNKTVASFHWHPSLIDEYFQKIRKVTITKKHKLPCMWEKGGMQNEYKRSATVFCNSKGKRKKAAFINQNGDLCCGEHALIVLHEGDIIVEVSYKRPFFYISILQIDQINIEFCEAEVHSIAECKTWTVEDIEKLFSDNLWNDKEVAKKYKNAIQAAYEKAMCYQCKEPHFVRNRN